MRLEGAKLALARDAIPTARQRAQAARNRFEEFGVPYWRGRSRQVQGAIERAEGNPDAAREQFRAALDMFEEVGAPLDALRTLDALEECCREQGDDGVAERWSQKEADILAEVPDEVAEAHRERRP